MLEQAANQANALVQKGNPLKLTVVQVGENPASSVYVNIKKKTAEQYQIPCDVIRLDKQITEPELRKTLHNLNADKSVTGILLQLPLPEHLDPRTAIDQITPEKDVDGLTVINAGLLEIGAPEAMQPATPLGVMRILDWANVNLKGLDVTVVGRSNLVGRPTASLLGLNGATVTICHHETQNLSTHTKRADLIVSATGVAHLIQPDDVKEGAMLIDVGVIPVNDKEAGKRKILGDISPDCVNKAKWQTPVPGGVGPMTVASLMTNVVDAAYLQAGQQRPGWCAKADMEIKKEA